MDTWTDSREHGPVVTVVTELTCLRGHRFSSLPSPVLFPAVPKCLPLSLDKAAYGYLFNVEYTLRAKQPLKNATWLGGSSPQESW